MKGSCQSWVELSLAAPDTKNYHKRKARKQETHFPPEGRPPWQADITNHAANSLPNKKDINMT